MRMIVFLLDNLFFFLAGAALLRGWMNMARVRMTQQPGQFVMAVSDWIVVPLRKALPRRWLQSRVDWGSLLAAVLLALLYALLVHLLRVGVQAWHDPLAWLWSVPELALLFLLRSALQGLIAMILVYVLFSWVQPHAPLNGLLARLIEPLLAPVRRLVPRVGGVDLSALVLMLLLQLALLALS
ncbi:MAG: hypothetical protein RJA36_3110 [Pseudomonadota bacterium]|jgi:YggT family protein